MNLLFDAWIPVVTRSGARRKIAPVDLTDPQDPAIDLDAVRHDFDGALAQFLIGACQSFLPPHRHAEWLKRLTEPPSRVALEQAFAPFRAAFELFDESHPFMQDTSLRDSAGEADGIGSLLIDAPGGNTEKENKDIFIKRGQVRAMAPDIAAQALLALQINAPSGGVGYRTGLRGGGPLTTLIWPRGRGGAEQGPVTLWEKVWLNVLCVSWHEADVDWNIALPWMRPVRTSARGDRDEAIRSGSLTQGSVDPLCFWASPCRLLLLHSEQAQRCDLSGEVATPSVSGVLAKNYGPNYLSDSFQHPLSPYYRDKPENPQWLPLHPRGGGLGFRDWPTFCTPAADDTRTRRPARNVAELLSGDRRREARRFNARYGGLWVFGHDMDNAKVLTWQESAFPLFAHYDNAQLLGEFAGQLVAAAELARSLLRGALKEVFGKADVSLADAAERSLLDRVEARFYASLDAFVVLPDLSEEEPPDRELRRQWARTLRTALEQVFDSQTAAADAAVDTFRHLREVALARGRLLGKWRGLHRELLSLPAPPAAARTKTPSRKPRSPA